MELPKKNFHPLYSGGALILGQEQDAKVEDGNFDPGKFDEDQSYSGHITQVEVWNVDLTAIEIYNLGNCFQSTVRPQHRVVTWDSNSWDYVNIDALEDYPLERLCMEDPLLRWMIWPERVDFNRLSNICDIVGGNSKKLLCG